MNAHMGDRIGGQGAESPSYIHPFGLKSEIPILKLRGLDKHLLLWKDVAFPVFSHTMKQDPNKMSPRVN